MDCMEILNKNTTEPSKPLTADEILKNLMLSHGVTLVEAKFSGETKIGSVICGSSLHTRFTPEIQGSLKVLFFEATEHVIKELHPDYPEHECGGTMKALFKENGFLVVVDGYRMVKKPFVRCVHQEITTTENQKGDNYE